LFQPWNLRENLKQAETMPISLFGGHMELASHGKHTLLTANPASRVRREIRVCKHPGCGEKFEGSPTSLYCLEHRTRKSRTERFVPKEAPQPAENNLVLTPDALKPEMRTLRCSLDGCARHYSFTLYPDRTIYPMYCEEHRSEHKRRHFQRMVEKGGRPTYEAPQWEKWSDYEVDFEAYAIGQPLLLPFGRGRAANIH
jgi:hypothetical protein